MMGGLSLSHYWNTNYRFFLNFDFFICFYPAQLFERRKNSHPEADNCWLVVGRAQGLLWVCTCKPPQEAPGGLWPWGHVAGRGVLWQLWNPGTAGAMEVAVSCLSFQVSFSWAAPLHGLAQGAQKFSLAQQGVWLLGSAIVVREWL